MEGAKKEKEKKWLRRYRKQKQCEMLITPPSTIEKRQKDLAVLYKFLIHISITLFSFFWFTV